MLNLKERLSRLCYPAEYIPKGGVPLKIIFFQKVLRFNNEVNFPANPFSYHSGNIQFFPADMMNFYRSGQYISGDISIGPGTHLAGHVAIFSVNRNPFNPATTRPSQPVKIREGCWVAHGATILPGVELGPHTIVAAGAVVVDSFPQGDCLLAGVPAKLIKTYNHSVESIKTAPQI